MSKQDTKLTPQILAMYLGCEILKEGQRCLLFIVENDGVCQLYWPDDEPEWYPVAECKPILRRLEDMTAEEREESWKYDHYGSVPYLAMQRTMYLLSKHFDLFGLIDAGLAIDAKTIEVNQQTPKP